MTSKDVVYTADNILCRVLRHDIQNHDHGHKGSAFHARPISTFVTPSEKYVVALGIDDKYIVTAQILQVVNKDLKSLGYYTFPVLSDRVEIINDRYVLAGSLTKDSRSILSMSDLDRNTPLKEIMDKVLDFCVSDQNILFISDLPIDNSQNVTAYKLIDGLLQPVSIPITVPRNYKSKCLTDNHILLAPVSGGVDTLVYVYAYDNNFTLSLRSQIKLDYTKGIKFDLVDNIITSSDKSDNHKFYDYDFK